MTPQGLDSDHYDSNKPDLISLLRTGDIAVIKSVEFWASFGTAEIQSQIPFSIVEHSSSIVRFRKHIGKLNKPVMVTDV